MTANLHEQIWCHFWECSECLTSESSLYQKGLCISSIRYPLRFSSNLKSERKVETTLQCNMIRFNLIGHLLKLTVWNGSRESQSIYSSPDLFTPKYPKGVVSQGGPIVVFEIKGVFPGGSSLWPLNDFSYWKLEANLGAQCSQETSTTVRFVYWHSRSSAVLPEFCLAYPHEALEWVRVCNNRDWRPKIKRFDGGKTSRTVQSILRFDLIVLKIWEFVFTKMNLTWIVFN